MPMLNFANQNNLAWHLINRSTAGFQVTPHWT